MSDAKQILEALLDQNHDVWQAMSMAEWFDHFRLATQAYSNSIDRAFLAGKYSASVGFAFAGAYQSAIEALFGLDEALLASVCVTEAGGNHPRAINTKLYLDGEDLKLSGEKAFVSGAEAAGQIYVACRDERQGEGVDAEGRPIIKLVSLRADTPGVEIHAMPSLGFVPEISHGKVCLNEVRVEASDVLQGDGYTGYVKAFRTYEDLHVCAAIVAYRLAEAIASDWGREMLEKHIALMLALRELNAMPLTSSAAHIALAACRSQMNDLIEASNSIFEAKNPERFKNWERDCRLLKVASKAHETRTQKAWSELSVGQ